MSTPHCVPNGIPSPGKPVQALATAQAMVPAANPASDQASVDSLSTEGSLETLMRNSCETVVGASSNICSITTPEIDASASETDYLPSPQRVSLYSPIPKISRAIFSQ